MACFLMDKRAERQTESETKWWKTVEDEKIKKDQKSLSISNSFPIDW